MDNLEETPRFQPQLESGAHTPLLYLLLPLIAGFAVAGHFPDAAPPRWSLLLAIAGCIAATTLLFRWKRRTALFIWGGAFCVTTVLASWFYYDVRVPSPPDLSQMVNREATIVINVERVFALKSSDLRVAGIGEIATPPGFAPEFRTQRIYFQCWKNDVKQPVGRGAMIQIKGKLEPTPEDPDGFDGYLRQQGCYLKVGQADLKEIIKQQPRLYQWFTDVNERWQAHLKTGADSPRTKQLAGIATAMLLGEKTALTTDQKERYIASGTMHLFAVSGLHVGIVAGMIAIVLAFCRAPRAARPVIGLILLMGYVQVTGAAPSAMRAWWMTFFFWTAYGLLRKPQPLSALAASALVVLLIDPRQLWSAGFQLSYTVVAGLLAYGAPLQDWLRQRFEPWRNVYPEDRKRHQRVLRWLTLGGLGLVAISFAATLYSAPLSIRYFGVLAPGAFLLNIPLVSLAPLAMTASMIAVICGSVGWTAGAAFANHASWVFITGMDALVQAFLKAPESSLSIAWRWPGGGYTLALVMVAAALLLADKRTPAWARFGVPPAIMLVGLVFGAELRHILTP